jgi:hypothetical protein
MFKVKIFLVSENAKVLSASIITLRLNEYEAESAFPAV